MDHFARHSLANPAAPATRWRSNPKHALGNARHRLNRFFNGRNPDRWAFTLNCTDALNMAFKGALNDGDHVITTTLEHNSVSRTARLRCRKPGASPSHRVPADAGGTIDPEAIRAAIGPKTRMVAMTHASNVLGTVQPVAECRAASHANTTCSSLWTRRNPLVCFPSTCRLRASTCLHSPVTSRCSDPTGTGALYVGSRVTLAPVARGRHRRRFSYAHTTRPTSRITSTRRYAKRPWRRGARRGAGFRRRTRR